MTGIMVYVVFIFPRQEFMHHCIYAPSSSSVLIFLETDYVSFQKIELIVGDDEDRYFFKTISLLEPSHTHTPQIDSHSLDLIVSYAQTHNNISRGSMILDFFVIEMIINGEAGHERQNKTRGDQLMKNGKGDINNTTDK